jgi:4-hydroxy-tetrahydrodipicolinate synthase
MKKKYFGVIPPIITPVDEHENVDEKGFRALLRHCVDHGLHGIFVAGTNGETMALTQEERDKAIRIALDEVGKEVPVMAGVMDTSTRRVIENIKRLEQMGGTCAVVTSIFYARHTSQDETIRHFEDVSRAANIDLAVYNIPLFTGIKLTAATMIKIARMDRVAAIKDASGDFGEFEKLLREYGKDQRVSVLQGLTVPAGASLLLGADGFVPSIAPLFPELFVKLYEAGKKADVESVKSLTELVLDTGEVLGMSKDVLASNKYALSLLGYTDKRLIRPVTQTSAGEEKNIREKVEEIHKKMKERGINPC